MLRYIVIKSSLLKMSGRAGHYYRFKYSLLNILYIYHLQPYCIGKCAKLISLSNKKGKEKLN